MDDEAKSQLDKIMKIDKSAIRKDLGYKSNTKSCFQKLKTIKTCGKSIFNDRITLHTAEKEQIDILNVYEFLIFIVWAEIYSRCNQKIY